MTDPKLLRVAFWVTVQDRIIMTAEKLCLALSVIVAVSAPAAAQQNARWTRVADLNTPQQYHACVAVDGKIYTVGGYKEAAFEEYDPASDAWRVLPAIPTRRAFPTAAAVGRRIYAIGGLTGKDETLASVECFDLDTKSWERCADLPTSRNRLAAVTTGSKILVIGGMDRKGNSSAVEEFDPAAGRWTSRAPMPTPRHGHSAVVIDGKVLVLGGYGPGPLATVEEYDPEHDRWTNKAEMPTPRGFFGAATANGFVFAIAGRVRGERPVERYDPRADTWKRLSSMPGEVLNRFGIAVVTERIYVVGGERQQDPSVPVSVWRYEPEE